MTKKEKDKQRMDNLFCKLQSVVDEQLDIVHSAKDISDFRMKVYAFKQALEPLIWNAYEIAGVWENGG